MESRKETNRLQPRIDRFFSRRTTRRALLGGAVLAGTGLATAAIVGCGSSEPKPSIIGGQQAPQIGSNPEIKGGFTHFKSQLYPYELDYPPSLYQHSQGEYYGVKTDIFAKSSSSPAGMVVRAEFVQDNIDTNAFMKSTIEKYKQDVARTRASIEGINTDNSEKIGGVRARIIEVGVSGNDGGFYQLKAYVFVRKGLGWDIHYFHESFDFDQGLQFFQKMVDSFRFTD